MGMELNLSNLDGNQSNDLKINTLAFQLLTAFDKLPVDFSFGFAISDIEAQQIAGSGIIDISHKRQAPTLGVTLNSLISTSEIEIGEHIGPYYVRLMVADRPGVIADITAAFRDENVSIESMIQRSRSTTEAVPVILNLHDCKESEIQRSLSKISTLNTVIEQPTMIRIETLS